jgi:hypothetical protein
MLKILKKSAYSRRKLLLLKSKAGRVDQHQQKQQYIVASSQANIESSSQIFDSNYRFPDPRDLELANGDLTLEETATYNVSTDAEQEASTAKTTIKAKVKNGYKKIKNKLKGILSKTCSYLKNQVSTTNWEMEGIASDAANQTQEASQSLLEMIESDIKLSQPGRATHLDQENNSSMHLTVVMPTNNVIIQQSSSSDIDSSSNLTRTEETDYHNEFLEVLMARRRNRQQQGCRFTEIADVRRAKAITVCLLWPEYVACALFKEERQDTETALHAMALLQDSALARLFEDDVTIQDESKERKDIEMFEEPKPEYQERYEAVGADLMVEKEELFCEEKELFLHHVDLMNKLLADDDMAQSFELEPPMLDDFEMAFFRGEKAEFSKKI